MTQPGFYALVYAAGLAFVLGFGPRRDALLSSVLAFPCGLALWVLAALVGVATGLAGAGPCGVAGLVAIGVASAARALLRPERPRDLAVLVGAAALFAAVALLLCQVSFAKFSPDSRQLVRLATAFARGGSLDEGARFLADRGVFTFLAYAAAEVAGVEFLYALAPLLGLSFAALFAVATGRALAGEGLPVGAARAVAAAVTAAVMSTFVVAYHMVYIHVNLGSALYLFGFAACMWLAERDRDPSLLAPAFLCLLSFALQRVEAPLFAALFAALAAWPSRLPSRLLAGGLAFSGAITAAWLLRLSTAIPATDFLTPGRAVLLSIVALAPLAALPVVGRLSPRLLDRHLGTLALAAAVAAVALTFAAKPGHMALSVEALATNVLGVDLGIWGYTWWMALLLGGLSLVTPPLRVGRPLLVGVLAALLLVLLLSFFRPPYRIGLADSGERMFIHFAPLLYFLYALKFAPLFARPADRAEAPS